MMTTGRAMKTRTLACDERIARNPFSVVSGAPSTMSEITEGHLSETRESAQAYMDNGIKA